MDMGSCSLLRLSHCDGSTGKIPSARESGGLKHEVCGAPSLAHAVAGRGIDWYSLLWCRYAVAERGIDWYSLLWCRYLISAV